MLMLAAALAALVIENTPVLPYFAEFWHTFEIGFSLGDFAPHLTLEHFINDFLMALFFLLVGLEIKFEMTAGELTNPRKALLPIVAAAGGAVVPALVYTAVNVGSGFEQGWGVPMANDIAFCLGILALLGDRVPLGLRVFLSTLTIADDMIAILVIAVFYTAELQVGWLAAGLALFGWLWRSTGATCTTCGRICWSAWSCGSAFSCRACMRPSPACFWRWPSLHGRR